MKDSLLYKILKPLFALLVFGLAGVGLWMHSLDAQVVHKLEHGLFPPPIEFYAAPQRHYSGENLNIQELKEKLEQYQYRERKTGKNWLTGDYSILDKDACDSLVENSENTTGCIVFRTKKTKQLQLAAFSNKKLIQAFSGGKLQPEPMIQLDPLMFAQYYGDRPVLRSIKSLSDYPTNCLNSVLAIEDPNFLDHVGISFKGIVRAFYTNFVQRRRSQGGSTITQQLIKNILLTPEKTIKRKVTEIAMAVMLEARIPKDKILQAYLNAIYMGQNGAYAVSGFAAASQHYFSKRIEDLNLNECASLAAILNSPGRYNPFRHPERLKERKNRVLMKMTEHGFIETIDYEESKEKELELRAKADIKEPAPYYVDAVRRKLKELNISTDKGLRVFTSMNIEAQKKAREAVSEGLDALESWYASLKKKAESGKPLQATLVAANPFNGEIEALIGGRNFKKYPYNRATRSHRQVGSVIKPFVYLAALESLDETGQPYTPLSILKDEKFEYEYEGGQSWSPENYSKEFFGEIPLYFALKNSLNSATAQLGLNIGLESIIDVLRRAGIQSKVEALPAMTLGAYELYPLEVLKAYTAISRFGSLLPLSLLRRVETLKGKTLFEFNPEPIQFTSAGAAATLAGMMKHTLIDGTGQTVRKSGFNRPAAGKTGTTSDTRDAWFSGFTPYHVATVWVGYDDNSIHGLTGATGAAPIWAQYMKNNALRFPDEDFQWPSDAIKIDFKNSEILELGAPKAPENVELIFAKGTEP